MTTHIEAAGWLVGLPVLGHVSDVKSAGAIDLGRSLHRPQKLPDYGANYRHGRLDPLAAERLRFREFNPEATVFIRCEWRMIAPGGPDQTDPAAATGQHFSYFDALVGLSVTTASIDSATLELSMRFEDHTTLTFGPMVYPYRMKGGYHISHHGK